MANPRSLVYALYTHWDTVEVLVRMSREFAVLTTEQVLGCIAKVAPQMDAEAQGAALRAMVNADILQPCARSSDLQLNAYVLDFVRGLTREHELGLAAVLQARVAAIREATEGLNEGMQAADMDRARGLPTSSLNSSARSACNWIKTATHCWNLPKTPRAPTPACPSPSATGVCWRPMTTTWSR